MVTYPSSFSRFRCTVSEKSISEIFSHFPFFSKFVHPLIMILLWEMHRDDRNMLSMFQINPLYRLGEMAKTSSGSVTMQQQQLERVDLNVETIVWSLDPSRGHLHRKNSHESSIKPPCNYISTCIQQMKINTCMQQSNHTRLAGT